MCTEIKESKEMCTEIYRKVKKCVLRCRKVKGKVESTFELENSTNELGKFKLHLN